MAPSTTAELDTWRETRLVHVDALTRFPGNARRGDVDEIRASIRRHGQYRALIVQDKGADGLIIVAGNNTFDGLIAEGYEQVRCELHDMDDDLAVRVNVADNQQAARGTTDETALIALLGRMGGDYEGLGYRQDQLDSILVHDVIPQEGPAPAPPAPESEAVDEGDDEGEPLNKGLGKPVISYTIVFDNEVQQTAWYEHLRWLRGRYRDLETNGERLHAYLGSLS